VPISFAYGIRQRFRHRCDHLTIRGRVDPDVMPLRGAYLASERGAAGTAGTI